MSLIQRKSDAHWYTRDGEPMHTVPYADKKRKDRKPTTLADARKLGLLPSVTTVLKVVAKPGLESWKLEQAIMASLTLPRKKDEPTEDFAKRVVEDMESEASSATMRARAVHLLNWYKVAFTRASVAACAKTKRVGTTCASTPLSSMWTRRGNAP